MEFVLTLVASSEDLQIIHLADIERYLDEHGIGVGSPAWLAPHKAADLPLAQKPDRSQIEALRARLIPARIDLFIQPQADRRKKLLLADMDSTIVTTETLDELAVQAGIGEEIAAITARAMRGELDFTAALRERVGRLKAMPVQALETVLAETRLTDGARTLVQTMAANDAHCVLVSGGFTFFTQAIAEQAGFHTHHGNRLEVEDGKLTGTVTPPILDKSAKLHYLHQYMSALGLTAAQTMAIGDGANDLPMLEAAGLGIGYHPKPALLDRLDNCILYGDLTAALYAQGYKDV